jgi:hypothetical protein
MFQPGFSRRRAEGLRGAGAVKRLARHRALVYAGANTLGRTHSTGSDFNRISGLE